MKKSGEGPLNQHLILAGPCPVPPGVLIFGRDLRTGRIIPICPECGFAWPEHPKRPMLITDYYPIAFACPDGVAIATIGEVEGAGLHDLVTEIVSRAEFSWELDAFLSSCDDA